MKALKKGIKLFVIFIFTAIVAHAQEASYFPAANNWEKKTPAFFKIDATKIKEAIQFSTQHESKFPRNARITQAMQYAKEPFGDPVGPMMDRGGLSGLIIYKGYIIAGQTKSYGQGDYDMYLIKTDSIGNIIWNKKYGGSSADHCFGMDLGVDGSVFLTGHTLSGTENWDTYTIKINNLILNHLNYRLNF